MTDYVIGFFFGSGVALWGCFLFYVYDDMRMKRRGR